MVQEDLVVGGGIGFLGRDVVFWLFCVFVQSCPATGVNCSTVDGTLCEAAERCGHDGTKKGKKSFHFRVKILR